MSGPAPGFADHPGYTIGLRPCAGRVVVRSGDEVLVDSRAALRLIETDHVERLYVPVADARLDVMQASDTRTYCPFKGEASYWSWPAGGIDDLLWYYDDPFDEVSAVSGYVGIYHEKASVTVVHSWPDGETASVRFPFWGDQSDLESVMVPVESGSDGDFRAPGYHVRLRNVVEGGQMVGQAVVAAARRFPGQRVTYVSTNFVRAAGFDHPIDLRVDDVQRGRTFSTASVRSAQGGRTVASSLVLLDSGAGDAIRGVDSMPDVPLPSDCPPYDMGVLGRDLRVVGGTYGPDPDRIGPPELEVWFRFASNPAETELRQALVAQATTHWAISAAMLPHPGVSEAQAHVSLSTGPMVVSVAFADDAPLDRWFLYSTRAIWSGRGLVLGDGRVWSIDGTLIASYQLQAMVRDRLTSAGNRDHTSAM